MVSFAFKTQTFSYAFSLSESVVTVLKYFLPYMTKCTKKTYKDYALVSESQPTLGYPNDFSLQDCDFVDDMVVASTGYFTC